MIETPEQVYQAIEQMGRMQRILESYRDEILTRNPRNLAVLAGDPWSKSGSCKRRSTNTSSGWKASSGPPERGRCVDVIRRAS